MADENTPAVEQGTGVPVDQIPTDFREFDHWRRTGELPQQPAGTQPAAADAKSEPDQGEPAPPAKIAPDSGTDDPQDPNEDPDTRKGGRERRIDKLTRENAELQRRLSALEQAGKPPQGAQPAEPPAAKPANGANPKPDLADYKTLEEYTEALVDWKEDQREAKRREAEARTAAEKAASEEQTTWAKREAAAAKAHPDYRDLVESTVVPAGPGVAAARQALLEDENGAEILYHLAKNPAELERIAGLSPVRATIEIGRLSASITASSNGDPGNPKPKVSGAPRPPSPIKNGTVKTSGSIYDEDTARNYPEWLRLREAQLKR